MSPQKAGVQVNHRRLITRLGAGGGGGGSGSKHTILQTAGEYKVVFLDGQADL